jgi:3-oxocholest-4-en-26-oyl-CoA dehydrogenase beta subunit
VDFSLTAAQEELSALSRRILTDKVTPQRLAEAEAGDRFDPVAWSALAEAGILSAALPESAGGAGYGLAEQATIMIELGRAVAPVPYLASIVLGAGAITEFGTSEQIARWAVPAGAGTLILTVALAEPDADDPGRPSTRAERAGGKWLLTGTKTTVPAGARADLILVPAATDAGVAVFAVQRSDPGVTVAPQRLVDGGGTAQLDLASVALPDDRVLGDADQDASPVASHGAGHGAGHGASPGASAAAWLAARATVGLCALQLGVTERALELTAEYARSREQFGRPIGAFQAVAQRLADSYIDVEAIRLTMWQAAWRLAAGLPCDTEIATAKFWAADAGHRIAHTAVHIHGGVGIDTDYPLHRYFTAAKENEFSLGGATTQLRRIGAALASGG